MRWLLSLFPAQIRSLLISAASAEPRGPENVLLRRNTTRLKLPRDVRLNLLRPETVVTGDVVPPRSSDPGLVSLEPPATSFLLILDAVMVNGRSGIFLMLHVHASVNWVGGEGRATGAPDLRGLRPTVSQDGFTSHAHAIWSWLGEIRPPESCAGWPRLQEPSSDRRGSDSCLSSSLPSGEAGGVTSLQPLSLQPEHQGGGA